MKTIRYLFSFIIFLSFNLVCAQLLKVKDGRTAIVKTEPTGNAQQIEVLSEGTLVVKLGEVPRYYSIQLLDGRTGYSYKGNLEEITGNIPNTSVTKESLLARSNVLKIIVIDVEVGDATLIICPAENGVQDIILIDTGEDDGDRIRAELIQNEFALSGQPITRFFCSHYDNDHMGDIENIANLISVAYDLGENDMPTHYKTSMTHVDRRQISLNYEETFSGGVTIECVAANQATDFDPDLAPSDEKNTNSIALIVSYNGFDYFTAGDLTFKPEKSLAMGIKNCDAYHVNHHGSSATSSNLQFVTTLDPEISVVSNGHKFGHPTEEVAARLTGIGSKFYQTNTNPDSRAHHPDNKFIGDITFFSDKKEEDAEGATGTIRIVVDQDNYYVLMPRLSLAEGTFTIER